MQFHGAVEFAEELLALNEGHRIEQAGWKRLDEPVSGAGAGNVDNDEPCGNLLAEATHAPDQRRGQRQFVARIGNSPRNGGFELPWIRSSARLPHACSRGRLESRPDAIEAERIGVGVLAEPGDPWNGIDDVLDPNAR